MVIIEMDVGEGSLYSANLLRCKLHAEQFSEWVAVLSCARKETVFLSPLIYTSLNEWCWA